MGTPKTCPFCNTASTIRDHDISSKEHEYYSVKDDIVYKIITLAITCPLETCREVELTILKEASNSYFLDGYNRKIASGPWTKIYKKNIEPETNIRPFPNYIPTQILQDYKEAKLISTLSPKASATLARRCLQSMIRDFYNISKKKSLHHEIEEIKDKIDPDMYEAIMSLKSIGNIGAHPEKDINLIIDVEPEEANELIALIEMLIEDWYITRHKRQERIKGIKAMNDEKQAERKGNTTTAPNE